MITSESIDKVSAALVEFQSRLPKITRTKKVRVQPKDTTRRPYDFWYAPFDEIIEISRPILTELGLAVLQSVELPNIRNRVLHSSGQFIETLTPIVVPEKPTSQTMGAAISYSCRYGYNTVLGIVADEDDDGNVADGNDVELLATKPQNKQPQRPPAKATRGVDSIKQIDQVASGDTADGLLSEIITMQTLGRLEAWGDKNADLIKKLPAKEQDAIRSEYKRKKSEFESIAA